MKTMLMLLTFLFSLNTQTRFVQGTVSDESGTAIEGVVVALKNTDKKVSTDINGFYSIEVPTGKGTLLFSKKSYRTEEINYTGQRIIDVVLKSAQVVTVADEEELEVELDVQITEETVAEQVVLMSAPTVAMGRAKRMNGAYGQMMVAPYPHEPYNTEDYATIHENGFKKVLDEALSTFSIDVDAASYSNMRRFINQGQLPPKDAVRIEEMINYFNYAYENPTGSEPFSINTSLAAAPWNKNHLVAQIGLQGKKIELDELPASNIVFLLDVSGSMSAPNKLPLLKSAMKLLVNELRPQDKVSIVVYAGAAGMVLKPTDGNDKKKIMDALDQLQAGGSTAGGAGIELAYKTAKEQFIKGGNNRVILATDGDFNVGASSNASMERLIEEKRNEGVFLTVLGFGMGNYKDSKMEILADKGNGNYAYIDNMKEAKKVLVNEFGGTFFTIAKDVKIQVEFNPAVVQAYRLIGYENRLLNNEDFNDDKKDAGELGSGHTVTALYEIIPVGVDSEFVKDIDPLKYQTALQQVVGEKDELLTLKFRYKEPNGEKSKLISQVVKNEKVQASENLNWSMAVAGFGMLLRESEYKGELTYADVIQLAKGNKGSDDFGYRGEFIELVGLAASLSKNSFEN